jgi:hypothetical protein
MEKRLNKKIETYVSEFKENIKKKITDLNFEEKTKMNDLDIKSNIDIIKTILNGFNYDCNIYYNFNGLKYLVYEKPKTVPKKIIFIDDN